MASIDLVSLDNYNKNKEVINGQISELKNDLVKFSVKPLSEQSTLVTLTDSADYGLQELHVFGKSTQDGTPTPDNPIDIVDVVNPTITVCGKNFFNFKKALEYWGADYSEKDNIYTFKVIQNMYSKYYAISDEDKTYSIVVKYAGGTAVRPKLVLYDKNDNIVGSAYLTESVVKTKCKFSKIGFDWNVGGTFIMDICISKDTTNNDIYEPYQGKEQKLNVTLRGIGDVKDEIIVYADGSGKLIQRIGIQTVTSDNVAYNEAYKSGIVTPQNYKKPASTSTNVFCNRYKAISNVASWSSGEWISNGGVNLLFRKNDDFASLEDVKNWLDSNTMIIIYELENPITTDLSAEKMKTYFGITNIFTDKNSEVQVKYVADTKLYIDKKFDELATALVAQTSETE